MMQQANRPPRVVVVGAGFGGLAVARGLASKAVEVVLIDRTNHNLFQPLLYQVATAALSATDIAVPVRSLVARYRNVQVLMGEVVGVDPNQRVVNVLDTAEIDYDFLVLANGSSYNWFGHDDWAKQALSLKTLDNALDIRRRLLSSFERAESSSDRAEIRPLLTFVVVGAGPTGVEIAGAISELARSALARDYRRIHPSWVRVILCEAGPHVLGEFPERLRRYARGKLARLGVEVRTGAPVQQVDAEGIVAGGERIEAANVLWCAGTIANSAARWLGAETDRHGTVKVSADCSVPGRPEIFAIGDIAAFIDADGKPLPWLAPVAKQQGRYVSRVIARRVNGGTAPGPFKYRDAGALAILGRSAAIADLHGLRLTGFLAWLLWGFVHLFFLIGARNRTLVFLNWIWAWLTYSRGARLITNGD